ncbi:MAG TPA: hypothetical protein VFN87_14315 [Solirubrobacteraceae bacterium]|nr:hypothetical protein [Solirubrobacteraceae bacterium]
MSAGPSPTSTLAAQAAAQAPSPATDSGAAFNEVLAVLVAVIILWLLSKSQAGHNAVYYVLLLLIVLTLVTQASKIAGYLQPISRTGAPLAG